MYQIVGRSPERSAARDERAKNDWLPTPAACGFILHMQQNRSHFPHEGRAALSLLALLMMLATIAPALKGLWPIPVFALITMAGLIWALEQHQTRAPLCERLELGEGEIRYADSVGRSFCLANPWVRLETEALSAANIRLMLRDRDSRFEVGISLNRDERMAVAPLIERALADHAGARR